ncbi:MAG: ParA family protein [Theionarchaea archaeon]|nr:MAG: hypothetical protein AYK18_04450 [Theionarchaea archaeon DG-70]MBU7012695.1 ParA family protein [Theionarchaea archaeon]
MNIAFFSYKGGVGRSLALLGVAASYASRYGTNIGIVDADIEAPSLHYLLDIVPEEDSNFVDILLKGTTTPAVIKERSIQLRSYLSEKKASRLGDGELFLYPSLPDKPSEIKIPRIAVDETTQRTCEDFLDTFSNVRKLEHVFVDCRTGFSRLAGMILNLADTVVLVCRIDRQNLHGVRVMIDRSKKRKKNLLIVGSMVPETPIGTQRLLDFQEKIDRCIDICLPLDERLIFGDVVTPLDYGRSDPISGFYEKVAEKIKMEEFNES